MHSAFIVIAAWILSGNPKWQLSILFLLFLKLKLVSHQKLLGSWGFYQFYLCCQRVVLNFHTRFTRECLLYKTVLEKCQTTPHCSSGRKSLEWEEYSSLFIRLSLLLQVLSNSMFTVTLLSEVRWTSQNRDNKVAIETTILTPYFPNSPWRDPRLLPWPVWNPICSFLDNPWATSPLPGDETGWHHPRQCFPICKEGNTMKICIL